MNGNIWGDAIHWDRCNGTMILRGEKFDFYHRFVEWKSWWSPHDMYQQWSFGALGTDESLNGTQISWLLIYDRLYNNHFGIGQEGSTFSH